MKISTICILLLVSGLTLSQLGDQTPIDKMGASGGVSLCASALPQTTGNQSNRESRLRALEHRIYRALIEELLETTIGTDDWLLIRSCTIAGPNADRLEPNATLSPEVIDSFRAAIPKEDSFQHDLDIYVPYKIINCSSPMTVGSSEFRREHPQTSGVLSLSRVGFNNDQTQALVYAEFDGGAGKKTAGYWVWDRASRNVRSLDVLR
jgi:hypothetical protein